MSFINKEDFKIAIRLYEVEQITDGDDTLCDIAISHAIGEMRPYLYKYDCERLFAAQGEGRPPLLVRYAVDIAIFELCSIARPDQDLENRRELYKRAIGWLTEVRDKDIPTDIPFHKEGSENPDEGETQQYFGSHPKRNNYF